MKRVTVALMLVLLTASFGIAEQKGGRQTTGFITGKDFLRFDKIMKQTYVMGVIDGMSGAGLFGAPERELDWLNRCLTSMKSEEVLSIVVKHLDENPDTQHRAMSLLIWDALREHCHGANEPTSPP